MGAGRRGSGGGSFHHFSPFSEPDEFDFGAKEESDFRRFRQQRQEEQARRRAEMVGILPS